MECLLGRYPLLIGPWICPLHKAFHGKPIFVRTKGSKPLILLNVDVIPEVATVQDGWGKRQVPLSSLSVDHP